MASGSFDLTTYYAKRIIGDTNAASAATALLQAGVDDSMWIFGHNRNNYGIRYLYDSSANGTADKIEFHGGHATNTTAWIQLDTGDASFGIIKNGTWQASIIAPAYGGTGVNSYAKGDILYAGAAIANTDTTALSKLALGTAGYTLQATANGPAWIQTVAVANGGTGKTSWTKGGIIYASATDTLTQIADGSADKVLRSTASATYSWLSYTSSSTASTIVYRDASKNFSAGTITASLSGNATSATKANITSNKYGISYYSDTAGTFATTAQGTSGYLLQAGGSSAAPSWIQATNANTASTIVKRDASGNFSAGTITASLSGHATSATSVLNRTSLTKGTLPSDTYWYNTATVYETGTGIAAGNRLAWIGGYVIKNTTDGTAGNNAYEICVYNYASGGTSTNALQVGIKTDGTAFYAVSSPAAFRTAISAAASDHSHSSITLSRVTESANHLPGLNQFIIREYSNTSTDTPSAHWYHIYEGKGNDAKYGTQLALGMSTTALYYRNYSNSAWADWQRIVTNSGTWAISISGNATSASAIKSLGRQTSTNITHIQNGGLQFFLVDGNTTTNKPASDGFILHAHWDGVASNAWDAQLFIPNGHSGHMQFRGHSNATTWGSSWNTLLDTGNYSLYALALSGGTMTGDLKGSKTNIIGSTAIANHWYKLYLGGQTVGSNAIDSATPLIEFSNVDRSQYCQLIYSDYDSVAAPDSLTLIGNQAGTHFIAPKINAGGYINNSYAMSTASFICESWVRTKGATGWYNEDYGGGWYMPETDTTNHTGAYIKLYGNKQVVISSSHTTSATNKSSQLIVSSVAYNGNLDTADAGSVAIELWRGGNASWQIINISGDLHFRNNWTTAKQSTYTQDSVSIAYNSGTLTAITGNLFSGTTTATSEHSVRAISNSGQIYLYSSGNANSNGNRGLYLPAHGSGAAKNAIIVDTDNNVTFYGGLSGNAATSTTAKYLMNRGDNTVTITNDVWTHGHTPAYHTNRATVWHQRWKQSGITYTPSGGSATTLTDSGDMVLWLSSHNTANTLQLNMAIDGDFKTIGSIYVSNWFRSVGNTGWYSQTHGGGWYMTDTKWVRIYNNKPVMIDCAANNSYGTNGHQINLALSGTNYAGIMMKGGNAMYGFYVNTSGYWYFANRTSGSFEDKTNDDYIIYGSTTLLAPGTSGGVSLGNTSNKWGAIYSASNIYSIGAGEHYVEAQNSTTTCRILLDSNGVGEHGLWSSGYYTTSNTYTSSACWILRRDRDSYVKCGTRLYGAVWNDYAEYRIADITEPGRVVIEQKNGTMTRANDRLLPSAKVISDTYGFAIGQNETANTPIAVSGRVLVYPYRDRNEYELGTAVCSAPNGTVDIMTREEIMMYPERIIGTVSEIPTYDIWHGGSDGINGPKEDTPVRGRIWIYVR